MEYSQDLFKFMNIFKMKLIYIYYIKVKLLKNNNLNRYEMTQGHNV